MSGRKEIFSELRCVPAGDVSGISGKASATLASGAPIRLQDALYILGMAATLVSLVRLFSTNGYTTVFGAQGSILDRQHRMLTSATCQHNGLYKLDGRNVMCTPARALAAATLGPLLITWHHRFGHLHPAAIQNLARSCAATGLELSPSHISKCSDLV